MSEEVATRIASVIPYFAFKGIDRFYDINGLLADPELFALTIQVLVDRYQGVDITSIGGFDARGFVLGPPLALALKKPFFMLRKPGKMPNVVTGKAYSKEYKGDGGDGTDALGIPRNAVKPGDRVLLIDDLVATGGTLIAGVELVKLLGGTVVECACLIELHALGGVAKMQAAHPDVTAWSMIGEHLLKLPGVTEVPEVPEDKP